MACYPVYSLRLCSSEPLRHLIQAAESSGMKPDIELRFSQVGVDLPAWDKLSGSVIREQKGAGWRLELSTSADDAAALRLYTQRHTDETTVYFGRGASRILILYRSDQAGSEHYWQDLSGWVSGSVLGYAMCLRGYPTLHGSVVGVRGRAVGLLGVSGAGKSTLAAAFVAVGHAMLADDHLVIGQNERGYIALPGPPRLRLWPTSLPILDNGSSSLPMWADADGKHYVDPETSAYCRHPLPLAAIYVLMPREPERSAVTIEDLTRTAALSLLMDQRFSTAPLSPTYVADSFRALSDLAQRTPVRLLYRPHGLGTLPAVIQAIEEDMSHHGC